ncbi:Csu type fimbrial protein [Caballeronia sordidicola]|jgi:spore coat protein U-like protein|uniref:Sigma-fimbriae tip adhesin n=1 Tax=Caballeronia sordidicola TaxID=196367 RepID=A0A226WZN0_CABSO|nr:spore coat U domain-containing protein [Caballeronia sordidicola]OXC76645.1 Sigma-fimbriae tip adhesin [Caballeronia sordidicola]OXC77218.1 Sigma-fimbriae tip adhesin [Caballeronia sordidicola]
MKRKIVLSMLAGALLFAPVLPVANAAIYSNGTSSANFTVSLTLLAHCQINATPLDFGTGGVAESAIDQQTTLAVTCTDTTPYNVGLDGGTAAGSTVGARLLAGTGDGNTDKTVNFQLYQDAGRTVAWGNTQGINTVEGTGNGSAQSITVYGRVPVQASPAPDRYQTTVTATVYF